MQLKAKLGIAPIAWSNDDLPQLGLVSGWYAGTTLDADLGAPHLECARIAANDPASGV